MAAFEKFGFQRAVGFSAVLTGVCALLRGFGGGSDAAVAACTVGLTAAQPFILNSPAWWPADSFRRTSGPPTTCSCCAWAYASVRLLEAGMTIRPLLTLCGAAGAMAEVPFVLLVREKPPPAPWRNRCGMTLPPA